MTMVVMAVVMMFMTMFMNYLVEAVDLHGRPSGHFLVHFCTRAPTDEVECVEYYTAGEERLQVLAYGLDATGEGNNECAADRACDGPRERGHGCLCE